MMDNSEPKMMTRSKWSCSLSLTPRGFRGIREVYLIPSSHLRYVRNSQHSTLSSWSGYYGMFFSWSYFPTSYLYTPLSVGQHLWLFILVPCRPALSSDPASWIPLMCFCLRVPSISSPQFYWNSYFSYLYAYSQLAFPSHLLNLNRKLCVLVAEATKTENLLLVCTEPWFIFISPELWFKADEGRKIRLSEERLLSWLSCLRGNVHVIEEGALFLSWTDNN